MLSPALDLEHDPDLGLMPIFVSVPPPIRLHMAKGPSINHVRSFFSFFDPDPSPLGYLVRFGTTPSPPGSRVFLKSM
ncbi:hypothetical protein EVAR_55366_1 [Eumeta japonica]|uniref:Uncharacterized protein n=1 Tax=Eumeta variegata TaxID=151549 RepID=A0A4C1YT33_EUMVA|nr:hypothetical protein EVAR_55366_1 [Eumeta japonica]